ncbi:DUF4114 domain-containing protein, partial [Kamptonema formosum]|uniref:DUF4114 domain-containing protein n=1 Tax=Kamptonema formosum TaxID=331992 RepID=UPI0005C5D4C3
MNPGDEFGIILAPRNRIQDVFNNPALTGTRRPLFSLATADPRDAFNSGQIADVTGTGYAFAFEDMQVNAGADKDYNDVMFQVAGATGTAPSVNNVIVPSLDWRGTVLGGQILDEINSADTEPPEIAAYLENDTGEDSADGITSDPAIAGTVIDVSGIFSLRAGFEGMPVESFTEIASRLNEDGTFSLDRNALEEIFGGALSEGSHTLYLRAIDEYGNVSEFKGIRFTLEPAATNDSGSAVSEVEFSVALAQIYGLDPYPDAVSLPVGGTRQLSVKVNGLSNSSNLNTDESGTRYEVSDPSVLSVSEDGLVTALKSGDATVTVSNGSAVEVIPIRVENPQLGPATLGDTGGVVRASDGSMVMVAPGALEEDTTVSLTPLTREDLSLPVPEGFEIAGAFNLDAGDDPMNVPAQLAIPAPAGLAAGTEVYFMRKGALPDETGTWNPIWLQEESGVVGADGMIRTSSPPWPGVVRPGEYIVVYSGPTGSATLVKGQLTLNYNFPIAFFGVISPGGIGQLLMPDQFGSGNAALTVSYDISSVKVMAVPVAGLPVITEVGVQRNQDGIASFSAALNMPAPAESDPTAPPVLQEAELKFSDENNQPFENNQPVLFLTGSNVLVNSGSDLLGSRFEDLVAKFYVGDTAYEGTVLPNLSRELGDNRFEVAVKVPNTVPLGASRIVLTRRQNHLAGQNGTEPVYEEVGYDSNNIRINQGAEYIFAAQRGADRLAVLDGTDPESVVEASNSSKLLLASIPVGTPERIDRPRASAVTSDGTRVYVVLESAGRVALVDPIVLQQVDTQPDIPDINPINLPAGAVPWSIVINSRNEYAYIADSARGNIYILDINPFSETYHQVVQTIAVNPASSGLRKMAISSDGRKLFVTAANGYIYVINIDGQDRPTAPNQNERKWHEQIGAVLTNNGADGVAATADPLKLTFTNGQQNSDAKGFGVLEVTNDDPLNFAASARYIDLSLGNVGDYFDVNEGVAVTVMPDGRYAFVAGRNRQGSVLQTDKRAGGNIGIIKDPLTNPQLVAATRPIPQALTADLVLSNDSKYLYASYPNLNGTGSTYVFDVEEIIETLENPGNFLIDG